MGQDVVTEEQAMEMVKAFMRAEFEGDRHRRRVKKIAVLEEANGSKSR
jgi:ribose 5-phosphate isomerase RpiB